MFKQIIKWCYGGYDHTFYNKHKAEIAKRNGKILKVCLITLSTFLSVFIILSFLNILPIKIIVYFICLGILMIMFLLQHFFASKSYVFTNIMFQAFSIIFLTFVILDNIIFSPFVPAIMVCVCFVAMPIIFTAPIYQMQLTNIIGIILFLILSHIYEDISIFEINAIFAICSHVGSLLISHYTLKNILENYELQDKLSYQNRYDPLTNIYNRRGATNKIEEIIKVDQPIAVGIFDIDDFKKYNDTYGHQGGDVVIKTVAEIFLYHVKKNGFFVARYGGEEFIVVTYGERYEMIEEILDAVYADIAKADMKFKNVKSGKVTISGGYAKAHHPYDFDTLLGYADQALYIAKARGKNSYVLSEYTTDNKEE